MLPAAQRLVQVQQVIVKFFVSEGLRTQTILWALSTLTPFSWNTTTKIALRISGCVTHKILEEIRFLTD